MQNLIIKPKLKE
jgi:hypothetical protein